MKNQIKEIYYAFGGKLVGTNFMKAQVCEVVSRMPPKVILKVTQTCWFISSMEDAWAFTFTGSDLRKNHLIVLSDALLQEEVTQIQYSIAHEIGHVVLNHRNSILFKQSKSEIKTQENEADAFAKMYINH